jgi:hypothetical protein
MSEIDWLIWDHPNSMEGWHYAQMKDAAERHGTTPEQEHAAWLEHHRKNGTPRFPYREPGQTIYDDGKAA